MATQRGLIVTGGHAPAGHISIPDRSSCRIVAADSGLDFAIARNIVPDAIVGDLDSVSDPMLVQRFPEAEVVRFDRAKDLTDTEIAIEYLWKDSISSITIVGGGGGRLDHLLGLVALFDRRRYPRRWVTDREEVLAIDGTLDFSGEPGEIVSFFPAGAEPVRMHSTGLRWALDGLEWHRGDVGISNECTGGPCRVQVVSGRLIMVRGLPSEVHLP